MYLRRGVSGAAGLPEGLACPGGLAPDAPFQGPTCALAPPPERRNAGSSAPGRGQKLAAESAFIERKKKVLGDIPGVVNTEALVLEEE